MLRHGLPWAATIVFAGTLLGLSSGVRAGPVYQNQAAGYSVTLPDGWAPLGAEQMKTIAGAFGSAQAAAQMKIDACYAPGGAVHPDIELMLVASFPNPDGKQLEGRNLEEFTRGITSGALKSSGPGATVESSKLNEAEHRFETHILMTSNGMKIHASLFSFFGSKGVVQMYAYRSDDASPAADAKYVQAAQSFHFDPGFAYDDSAKYVKLAVVAVMAVLVIAGVVLGLVLSIRSSRRKPAAAPFPPYGGFPQPPFPPPPSSRQWPPR